MDAQVKAEVVADGEPAAAVPTFDVGAVASDGDMVGVTDAQLDASLFMLSTRRSLEQSYHFERRLRTLRWRHRLLGVDALPSLLPGAPSDGAPGAEPKPLPTPAAPEVIDLREIPAARNASD